MRPSAIISTRRPASARSSVSLTTNSTDLHDGRARTLTAAIELHGGEGQASADAFVGFGDADRNALLAFLRSL